MIVYKHIPWADLQPHLRNKVRSLSYRETSDLLYHLSLGRSPFMVLAWNGAELAGWCACFNSDEVRQVHFYVRASLRRQGIGTSLVKEMESYLANFKDQEFWLRPWDGRSRAFLRRSAKSLREEGHSIRGI